MSAPVPDATGDQGGALDLDGIEARARHSAQWGDDAHCATLLALVAEVRRLRAQVEAGRTWAMNASNHGVLTGGLLAALDADSP